ncbi:class I adenylate-forming enzyme family protein [Prosthecomicrobium sp. N25]|uniref:class I adenylate-forming enzyme family protein n=1 Tax=Prosthecomicrobium sp. N25 TaxID=3129254 RepID=UPI003077CC94
MIVVSEERSAAHLASGVWGRVTLDQILKKNAQTAPDRIAVADFSDRPAWTPGPVEALTYRVLDARIEAIAGFFSGLGLQTDAVIGLQLPPTADSVAIFFGALRAGLVVAPLPLALREAEVAERMKSLGAKAMATVAETAGERHGERLRAVAAELFQIRFVFGAGAEVPDGLIPLERLYAEMDAVGPAPDPQRRGNAADHCATVSFVTEPREDGVATVPVPRSHNHWIATGLMTLLEAQVETGAVIVSPFAPAGLIGIGAGLMPWLLAAGTLVTGMPGSAERIAEEATTHGARHVLAPARFARRVAERLEAHRVDATVLVIGSDTTADQPLPRGYRAVDVVTLAERAVVARRRRDATRPVTLPVGRIGAPSDTSIGPTLVETRLIPATKPGGGEAKADKGEIALRGAMVPDGLWQKAERPMLREKAAEGDGWVRTGLGATLTAEDPTRFVLAARTADIGGRGALDIDLGLLDRIFLAAGDLIDAAAIPIQRPDGSERIAAAVVPRPGSRFDRAGYLADLAGLSLGLHRMPVEVFTVPAIARAPSGRVLRAGMASRLAPAG